MGSLHFGNYCGSKKGQGLRLSGSGAPLAVAARITTVPVCNFFFFLLLASGDLFSLLLLTCPLFAALNPNPLYPKALSAKSLNSKPQTPKALNSNLVRSFSYYASAMALDQRSEPTINCTPRVSTFRDTLVAKGRKNGLNMGNY